MNEDNTLKSSQFGDYPECSVDAQTKPFSRTTTSVYRYPASKDSCKATIPPSFSRKTVCLESTVDTTVAPGTNGACSESDGDRANTKTTSTLFLPTTSRSSSESSDDSAQDSLPPSAVQSFDSSCTSNDEGQNETPKVQLMHKKISQSSIPTGSDAMMGFDYSTGRTHSGSLTGSEISSSADDCSQRGSVAKLPVSVDHGNLIRYHPRQVDPNKFYQFLYIVGTGSIGSVCRVRKRVEVIGGSARSSFVQSRQRAMIESWKSLQSCFFPWCPAFAATNDSSSSRDLFQAVDNENLSSQDDTESRKKSSPSKLIAHNNRKKHLEYALKMINLDKASSSEFMRELENEVDILKELDHPNIVRLIETFHIHNQLFVVMELCLGGDLYSRDPYTEHDAAKIVKSVFGAIAYMHSKNIIHRDIKFENIMFTSNDENADVKLIDFGLSKKFESGSYLHDTVGTVYTMSPELLRGKYTCSADIWSMGVITYMLLSSCMPFWGGDRDAIIQKVIQGKYRFATHRWKFISSNARKFVSLLLRQDANKRPTAAQALKHSWLYRRDTFYDMQLSQPKNHQRKMIDFLDNVLTSINMFADYVTLKKLALMIVAYKSTSQEIGWLRQIFDRFDRRKDGEVTLNAFKSTLQAYLYSDDELERMFMGMDIDGNGTIHYCEFLAATIEAQWSIDEQRLAEAFDRLDCDNSGDITVKDLKAFLGSSGSNDDDVPLTFLEETIAAVDMNHDQKVSYDEFLLMWDQSVDETRMMNKLQVQQRRIQHADSKQSLTSITSSESEEMTSDSGMSSSGGGGNAEKKPSSASLASASPRQAMSNAIPPTYPSKRSTTKQLNPSRRGKRKVLTPNSVAPCSGNRQEQQLCV